MDVLVVSESADQRSWVSRALGRTAPVLEATNGRDALRMVVDAGGDVGLVVTDETAEPFGAFGLSRELKLLIDPPKVIVLLDRQQDQWLARWSGADRWLLRPVDPFALADAAADLTAGMPASRRRT